VCPSTDPKDIQPYELAPRGATALLDAMGRSIREFAKELGTLPEAERPAHVICAVMTDGIENASTEFGWDTVKQIVARQQNDEKWRILYLGANQDAFVIGDRFGAPRGQTMTYASTTHGT
jgi:hypothetical protein